ncbi:MAG: hypothetical protein V4539_01300 [Bacteroidota bacterium]
MQTANSAYLPAINQRNKLYSECLIKVDELVIAEKCEEAIVRGLQTIIYCCTGTATLDNNIPELISQCSDLVTGFPVIDFSKSTSIEIAQQIKGILIERTSFYKQLESLTH